MILKSKSLLVIAAHPDDEVLGCGGTLLKLKKKKCKISILFISDGVSSRENIASSYNLLIKKRYAAAKKVAKIIGAHRVDFLSLPDNNLEKIGLLNITKKIERLINIIKPDTILTHSNLDLNLDHQLVNKSVLVATRPQNNGIIKNIYSFEILSSSEWNFGTKIFEPNHFVDISNEIKSKIKLIGYYNSELRKWPHPRSKKGIEVLANFRGQSVGVKFAEAFKLIRSFE